MISTASFDVDAHLLVLYSFRGGVDGHLRSCRVHDYDVLDAKTSSIVIRGKGLVSSTHRDRQCRLDPLRRIYETYDGGVLFVSHARPRQNHS